jgi:mono/diheme cytochrome c family protein
MAFTLSAARVVSSKPRRRFQLAAALSLGLLSACGPNASIDTSEPTAEQTPPPASPSPATNQNFVVPPASTGPAAKPSAPPASSAATPTAMSPMTQPPQVSTPAPMPPVLPSTSGSTSPAATGAPLPTPRIRVSEAEFPQGIREILERRCVSCHTYGDRDPIGWGSALDLSRMIDSGIVVPGDPNNSRLIDRVAVRADMPYNGARLSGAEVQALRAWIANLSRAPATQPRTDRQILDRLVADGASTRPSDTRYLSLTHFFDEHRAPEEIKAAEEVLTLSLNSLSRRAALVALEPVDAERSLFRFRLSALGWSESEWNELTSFYPYCLRSDDSRHNAVYARLRTEAPFVRGDWFVATATRPPLYQRLLDLPDTLNELADSLGVDIENNLNHPGQSRPTRVARIGFRSSGVSGHNRIIDRHERSNGGYFWVSYDFNSSVGRADIRENPLGPSTINARNFEHTFIPAGGELIWTLPNGLYGYMLVDGAGRSVNAAPKDIVRDLRRGGGAVETGVSCFGCHGITGMNRPRIYDEITAFAEEHRNQFSRAELDEIRALYPTNGAEILSADADRYLAVTDALGLRRAVSGVVEYDDFINLVGGYEAKLGLRGAAVELGLSEQTTRTLVSSGRNEDALPLVLSDPLVTRQDFVCRFRALATRQVRNARFCANTFTAPEVRASCP